MITDSQLVKVISNSQVGKVEGRLSGSNKLGRVASGKLDASVIDPERAPAAVQIVPAKIFKWRLSGGALRITKARRPTFRLPPSQPVRPTEAPATLPSLFDPPRRPNVFQMTTDKSQMIYGKWSG
jgi:hypothetical protein